MFLKRRTYTYAFTVMYMDDLEKMPLRIEDKEKKVKNKGSAWTSDDGVPKYPQLIVVVYKEREEEDQKCNDKAVRRI